MNVPTHPRILVLCGSTRFRAEMTAANRWFTLQGFIVLAPGVFGHDGDPITDEQKEQLDELHFRKIDLADEVFVVDPEGYVGESTRLEMSYARRTGKRVTRLSVAGAEPQLPPQDVTDPAVWLVWSNAEGLWWRANGGGYTQNVLLAGCYTKAEAEKACRSRSWDGEVPPEVMVELPDLNVFVAAREAAENLRQSVHQATKDRIAQRTADVAATGGR